MRVKYEKSRGSWEELSVPASPTETLGAFRARVAALVKKHVSRVELRGTNPADKAIAADKHVRFSGDARPLAAFGAQIADVAAIVYVKDLGPQFSYRGVFIIEYGGPLALMALYALRPAALFGGAGALPLVASLTPPFPAPPAAGEPAHGTAWASFVQCLAVVLYLAHFVKREAETCVSGCGSRPLGALCF